MTDLSITKDCVQVVENIGRTVYVNICTGTSTTVMWGDFSWILACIAVVAIFATAFIVYKIYKL